MKVVTLVKASLCNVDFFKFVQIHWEERELEVRMRVKFFAKKTSFQTQKLFRIFGTWSYRS